MINIVPQVDKVNRGAWLESEMLVECLRDLEVLTVIGGAVYPGSGPVPDDQKERAGWFRETHNIENVRLNAFKHVCLGKVTQRSIPQQPLFFWRVIQRDPARTDVGSLSFPPSLSPRTCVFVSPYYSHSHLLA